MTASVTIGVTVTELRGNQLRVTGQSLCKCTPARVSCGQTGSAQEPSTQPREPWGGTRSAMSVPSASVNEIANGNQKFGCSISQLHAAHSVPFAAAHFIQHTIAYAWQSRLERWAASG